MLNLLPHLLLVAFVGIILTFLIFRLRFFSTEGVSGKVFFSLGSFLLLAVTVWEGMKRLPAYNDWFIVEIYPIIDATQFIIFLIGVVMLTVGLALYADFWQSRRSDIETREQKLSVLNNLQRDARGPYQFMQLLDMSVKEIISYMPECSGAVFLLNRNRRQFVLASAVGFSMPEQAALEYFPLERNLVSQSIDVGEPLLGGKFEVIDRSGKIQTSRFNSSLVLPLVSGMDKIGAIILLSEDNRYFSNQEVRYLQPVAEWLAEKIKSARLERELSSAHSESKRNEATKSDLTTRILGISDALNSTDPVVSFCRSLVGLATAKSAHIAGIVNGQLQVHGGSEPLVDLSESYKTALVDAVDRNKPLIINQEATTDDGRQYVAFSTLVYPMKDQQQGKNALLMCRDGAPFKLNDFELKTVEIFAHLGCLVFQGDNTRRQNLTHRKGFQTILNLIQFDPEERFLDTPGFLMEQLKKLLPSGSIGITHIKNNDGSMKAVTGYNVESSRMDSLEIFPGEGVIGMAVNQGEVQFAYGRNAVAKAVETFEPSIRDNLYRMFGERGLPLFIAACPIQCMEQVVGVVTLFLFELSESEQSEWERLLTLAVSLYSMRLTAAELHRLGRAMEGQGIERSNTGTVLNHLNNHLSAIVGNAELAISRPELDGESVEHLRSIVLEAEQAAGYLKDSLGVIPITNEVAETKGTQQTLDDLIQSVLNPYHVSGKLYMIGGHPREVSFKFDSPVFVDIIEKDVRKLAESALEKFAATADEDDRLTVSTYRQGKFVYLDISRHRENFPPVERVAGFGDYKLARDVLRFRPADNYLRHAVDSSCLYAYDRMNQAPSYLSFKFPVRSQTNTKLSESGSTISVLAVDDQTVILDLISAMCQSLNYRVKTATNGRTAIQAVKDSRFDIALIDLAMPEMSGLEVAARIRKIAPNLPIVLVTGWEVDIDTAKLEAIGIEDVLYKPFRIEHLTEKIQSLALSSLHN